MSTIRRDDDPTFAEQWDDAEQSDTDTVHGIYPPCRRLTLALWNHPQGVDGIEYRSRFDNDELCIVLFDRARDAVVIDATSGLMDNLHWLAGILDRL